jgi:uncharacterized protein (TIGR02271 family)
MAGTTGPNSGRPIVDYADERHELHDADGDAIGDVLEVNPDFLIVRSRGGFLRLGPERTYYVPRSAVARQDYDDWYLSIDKDELGAQGWSQPPDGSTFADLDHASYQAGGSSASAPERRRDGTRLVRYEVELHAQKVAPHADEVSIRTSVVEGTPAFSRQRVSVPVMEESVENHKVAWPVEEVEVGKVPVEETRQAQDTVRNERFDIKAKTHTTHGERVRVESLEGDR